MAATADQRRTPDPQVEPRATNRRFSAAYKQKVLTEYDGLSKLEKGALLRREGLYSSLLASWRSQRDVGGEQALARPAVPRLTRETSRSPPSKPRSSGFPASWTRRGR